MGNTEVQRAQDMLAAMQVQRDQALNAVVVAQAEIAGYRRQISDLEQALKEAQRQRDAYKLDLDEGRPVPSS